MNVKHFSGTTLLMLLAIQALAQPYNVGIRSQAMGGAGAAEMPDAEAIFVNPALLANLTGASVTLFYSRPFGLREVDLASIAAAVKIAGLGCGLAIVDFGNSVYHDRYYHAALARSFGSDSRFAFSIGAQLKHLSIQGYGSAMALGVNLGTAFQLNSKMRWGIFLNNVNQPRIGAAREKLPPFGYAGMAFSPRDDWTLQLDFYREFGFADEIRFGAEARVLPMLLLRLGAATNPDRFGAGFTIDLSKAALHAAANTHSDLGTTQFYAISIGHRQRLGEKNK